MAELADYAWLIGDEGAPWIERMAHDGRSELQQLAALRRELSAERARLVVEQVELRRRGADKFGERAATMLFSRVHLEQATDLWIARYKAARLAVDSATTVDFCCGIGGDLLALADPGAATGWDLSEVVCLLAKANVGARADVNCGDVESLTPDAAGAWHLDPDRRPAGRRTTAVAEYAPGPALVERWLAANPRGAVKLAPAAEAPPEWAAGAELEWITRDRECRQQVAWFGPLATTAGRRRATVVHRNGTHATLVGDFDMPCEPADDVGAYLCDPDPSVLAAGLLGALAEKHGLSTLGVGGAYLTGDAHVDDPLAAEFVVRDCLPLRTSMLAKYLAERSIGCVEIKKRGVSMDPEALRRQLKLRGDDSATIVLTRIGVREVAIVAERVST